MRLAAVFISLSFAALSSALFGPVPYLSELAASKAGLGLLATKSVLLSRLLGRKSKDTCEDAMKTIVEVVCKPATIVECKNEPQEECHDTLIEVCKAVDEEICEEVEENVCRQVSKQECPEPVESCITEQKCRTITEKKCNTDEHGSQKEQDAKNTPEGSNYFCDKEWLKFKCLNECKDEPELCTPWARSQCIECGFEPVEKCWQEEKEICEDVTVPCNTVFVPECRIETVPRCKLVTNNICKEEPKKVCDVVDRKVCSEKTTEECEEVEKKVANGKQC